jgi:stress response protein YsnF
MEIGVKKSINNSVSSEKRNRIKDLLKKLRTKLKGFTVVNLQGQILGRVEDLTLDQNYRLNVVISKQEEQPKVSNFLLSSKYIEKVDTNNRTLLVDLSLAELNQLPLYSIRQDQELKESSAQQSVTQVSEMNSDQVQKFNEEQSLNMEVFKDEDNENGIDSNENREVVEEEIVRLLEERLVVNRSKHKVGEVVVRKEIETQIVEVPIHREKLIVEQVGSETKQLAEIDLGKGEITGVELAQLSESEFRQRQRYSPEDGYIVTGEFVSPKAASNLLEAIALKGRHGCEKIRVEILVESQELQESYQQMFDRCSIRTSQD